ncbi:hypothetical protein [Pseudonocardia sp. ICBG1293]|uniref:hypothetical protein n=1 Tax=Pseudonocardia sp. ICBG1293 TaxID=2844382 RepID=UPI001CCE4497|nr:hypothetical protein [Pseudonocardia sp. ICBG1293]
MTAGVPVRDRSARLAALRGSPALRMVGKRTLMAVPIVLGASVLTFWVLSLIPGGAAQQLLGPEATAEQLLRWNGGSGSTGPDLCATCSGSAAP